MIHTQGTNPWFFVGVAGEGIGGPHVGTGHIWPMAGDSPSSLQTTFSALKIGAQSQAQERAATGVLLFSHLRLELKHKRKSVLPQAYLYFHAGSSVASKEDVVNLHC
jgi:hypothetical protein